MHSRRLAAPALTMLFAGCTPLPANAPKPSGSLETVVVKDANTAQPIDYTVRAEKFVSTNTVNGKLEQVWSIMPDVYKQLALPVDGLNAATHSITTGQVHMRRSLNNVPLSRFMECGRATLGPNADVYDINLKVETAIGGADGAAVVQSSLTAVGSGVGNGGSQVRCSSTGELEGRIAAKIAELLAKK